MTATPADPPIGNTARFAARPLSGSGTPAHVWINAERQLPDLDLGDCTEIVVVAAHPDDETLGFGAASAMMAERGVQVQVVSASDGGASHATNSLSERRQLEQVRRAELHRAVGILGLPTPVSLGLPDGELSSHEGRLVDLLTDILAKRPPGTWCAANWRGDGHPDHEAVGRAAAVATQRTGAVLLEYPVWMWHWALPGDGAVPWDRAQAAPLSPTAIDRKTHAAQCFRSQFEPLGATPAVLPPSVLRRLLAVGEVVFR
ncbi:PIG-L deacetylase family protein [Mycolicibacterium moriokaense]|uniref:LmbE family N-acetylglucosaminyl deacetylase n=1 Tax=Mycolicibacterium moriokaense TaxID=39691 RepID=A0A318HHX4_9MYCO|nr:PIG-L family deacetylase [Mycolicibacterium moriokaense]PXX09189.1 LmbE family N-acetylglucosaminyl deacetylase [Mycolicibacterium moriokaense]